MKNKYKISIAISMVLGMTSCTQELFHEVASSVSSLGGPLASIFSNRDRIQHSFKESPQSVQNYFFWVYAEESRSYVRYLQSGNTIDMTNKTQLTFLDIQSRAKATNKVPSKISANLPLEYRLATKQCASIYMDAYKSAQAVSNNLVALQQIQNATTKQIKLLEGQYPTAIPMINNIFDKNGAGMGSLLNMYTTDEEKEVLKSIMLSGNILESQKFQAKVFSKAIK